VTAPAGGPPVAVVGGGVSGLACAHFLRRAGREVVVLEASDRAGGKLRREEVGGVSVDVGAESFLFRRPEAVELAADLGLQERLLHPVTYAARIWSRGELRPLPRSVMGVPGDLAELSASGLLSPEGMAQVREERDLPAARLDLDDPGWDVAVGELVAERLGGELLDRVVEPLLGGVYAGHAREISARAATPQVVELLARHGSLLRGAEEQLRRPTDDRPVFAGLRDGVTGLVEALAVGLDVRTGTTVRALERTEGGWVLVTGPTREERRVAAAGVVLATPAPAAAKLLSGVASGAAAALAEVEVASMAVVTLAFPVDRVPAVAGSGFLVPPVEGRAIKAATYSFQKWAWLREAAAGEGLVHLRVSVGRHREAAVLQRDDDELVALALADLRTMTGIEAPPVDAHVQRWGGGLPQYAVGHLARVRRVRGSVAEVSGLAVCGATYEGVGIPACIASARLAATQVLRGQ
jgi:protoporphyrinogen/coproporphyrinogen III oxidase